jgi:hypothetical protein
MICHRVYARIRIGRNRMICALLDTDSKLSNSLEAATIPSRCAFRVHQAAESRLVSTLYPRLVRTDTALLACTAFFPISHTLSRRNMISIITRRR